MGQGKRFPYYSVILIPITLSPFFCYNRGMRDTQRGKVYSAEGVLNQGQTLRTVDECQLFVNKVVGSAYFKRHYRVRSIDVLDGRGRSTACAGTLYGLPMIKLPIWSRTKPVILHEIAHHAAGLGHKHDWKFAAALLDLVRHFLGAEQASILKASYRKERVRFREPRPKRQLTDEQRAVLVERMRLAREAKAAKADA